jgi:hypothetical protein
MTIPSHAFYLVSQGGQQATDDSVINVHSIGISEAADIFYDANLAYFDEGTTFAEAAEATARSAAKLGKAETASVVSAWYAVGVIPTTWGHNNDGWKVTFTGWTYFDASFYAWSYDYGWIWWSIDNIDIGGFNFYLFDSGKWVYTSAEMYPWYYDYSTGGWGYNSNGNFVE